jgi:hypothetical protein
MVSVYALPSESRIRSPQGEKHEEEDDCQDFGDCVFAARLGRNAGPGR